MSPHPHNHACGHTHAEGEGGSLAVHHGRADAICLDHVSFSYAPGRTCKTPAGTNGTSGGLVLRDVTLHIEQGANLGVIGPNGAGKTTLLKIILGLLEGYTGSVSVMGISPREACRRGGIIGYVPQRHQAEWRFPVSAEQVVRMGLVGKTGLFRWYAKEDKAYVLELMDRVGVADLRHRPISDLSGGQQQRLFIARALVSRPKILVLDEPLVGVDEVGQRKFAELIHQLHRSLDLTIVLVSHDLKAIAAGCNRVACLNQTIHYHDAPEGLNETVLREVFQHEIAPVIGKG